MNADKWSDTELQEVIHTGGCLLGVTFDDNFSNGLISIARESVYVVQEACRRVCLTEGIKETTSEHKIVGSGVDVDALVKEIVDQQSARYDGFLTNFADGFQETELEMHKWLLYPILSAGVEALEKGLKYRDIKNTLFEKHPRKSELNPGNITQSLQSSASLQVKKNIMPIIIDYDQSSKTLHIVDKGFLIWLQHQDASELLEDLNLPK